MTSALFAAGTVVASTPARAADNISASPQGACQAGWYYNAGTRGADSFAITGPTYSNYNGTGAPATATFTATQTGTVSTTYTGTLNVSVQAMIATVNASFSVSGTTSLATSYGNQFAITVPAYRNGNAQYGVWRAVAQGRSDWYTNNCVVTQTQYSTAYVTYKTGWNTWIS